jgi:hypothetical protein
MNKKNECQHYVSKVLLERFRVRNCPLECYQVQTGKWEQRSVKKVCSARGYNQLLMSGDVNNSIEDSFSKVESNLSRQKKDPPPPELSFRRRRVC